MKLDKEMIKKKKLGFFFLCLFLLVGIIFMLKIFDCLTKTTEIEAVVCHVYETDSHRVGKIYTHGGPRMVIEWVDLNGETHMDGSLYNEDYLEEGDIYPILVDAETQSKRVLNKGGSIVCFILGVFFTVGSLLIMRCCYVREYEYGD